MPRDQHGLKQRTGPVIPPSTLPLFGGTSSLFDATKARPHAVRTKQRCHTGPSSNCRVSTIGQRLANALSSCQALVTVTVHTSVDTNPLRQSNSDKAPQNVKRNEQTCRRVFQLSHTDQKWTTTFRQSLSVFMYFHCIIFTLFPHPPSGAPSPMALPLSLFFK